MNPKDLFTKNVQQATTCLQHVYPGQLSNSTPCTEWDVRAVLNHMTNELRWVQDLLSGRTINEVGDDHSGDLLGDDFKRSWQIAADTAIVAVNNCDLEQTIELSYGKVPASDYITDVAGDILIHTWDMSRGIRCTLLLEPSTLERTFILSTGSISKV